MRHLLTASTAVAGDWNASSLVTHGTGNSPVAVDGDVCVIRNVVYRYDQTAWTEEQELLAEFFVVSSRHSA